ncbi:MAG: thioredoxin fold domain-containing protein, partial [Planctomycetales bacterium]|nr:thioredoxin fold domain-containing protein [Planctomycetales bacterium]
MVSLPAIALSLSLAGVGQPVLLDFYSDQCPPCRQMAPLVAQMEAAGYPIQRINVTQQPHVAQQYGVSGVPCFILVNNGQMVDRVVGATPVQRLVQMFQRTGWQPGMLAAASGAVKSAQPAPRPTQTAAASGAPQPAAQEFPSTHAAVGEAPPVATPKLSPLERAMAASVRIKIDERGAQSFGSGTVVDAQDDEA